MDEPFWGGVCEVRECARIQSLENCSFCADFPCEVLLDISLDPDSGDDGARIDRLRLQKNARDDRRMRVIRRLLLGGSVGAVVGLLLAGIFGGGLAWFFALGGGDYRDIPIAPDGMWVYVMLGTAVGLALPWIIESLKRYMKNGKD
jgi:hypothetical protein